MTARLVRGLAAAVLGAALYGSAPAVQAIAARREPAGRGVGMRLTARLVRRPIWLAGLGVELLGFVVEAYAFSSAPVTLVAPVMTCDMIVFVLLVSRLFGERLTSSGVGGIAAMTVGVALLAVAFAGSGQLGEPATDAQLLVFLAACVAVAAAAAMTGTRATAGGHRSLAAVLFSAASGISYGFATMTTRQIGRTFSTDAPWHLLATATPYVLVGCSVLAIAMMQRGLQTSPLLTYPVTSAASSLLPVILGAALLDDPVPHGAAEVAFVGALLLLGAGVTLLARDRARAAAYAPGDPSPRS